METLAQRAIKIYQNILSPVKGIFAFSALGPICRFYPSCSEYMYKALKKYGLAKGFLKGFWRLVRCGPWSRGGIDPP